MTKKELIIIGAGISGLFLGKKYKEKYNVTVLEKNNKIGGKIQCHNGISTSVQLIFPYPSINEKQFSLINKNKKKLKVHIPTFSPHKIYMTALCLLIINFIILKKIEENKCKLLYILIILIVHVKFIFPQIIKNSSHKIQKALGGAPVNYVDFIKASEIKDLILFECISLIFYDIYEGYLDNTMLNYINYLAKDLHIKLNTKILSLDKKQKNIKYLHNGDIIETNYDKLVICHNIFYCDYIDVTNIVPKMPLMDFYTIIVKKPNNPQNFPKYISGYTEGTDFFIISSHTKPKIKEFSNLVFIKKWKMPYKFLNNTQKLKLSNFLLKYNIYSIGEHLNMGVNNNIYNADKLVL